MQFYSYNGKIFEEKENIIGPTNRGLRYGDGIFETIKLKNGNLILQKEHFERLWLGMKLLKFEIPKHFTAESCSKEILLLAQKNKLSSARVRFTVIRGDGGLYDTKNHHPNYIIETIPLADESKLLNNNGLRLCIFKDAIKTIDTFSNIKHNNYLPYFMGALFAKESKCNDAIILNNRGNISDSTIANIFFIKDEIIYTNPLSEGCVAGVMRHWVIEALKNVGFKVEEKMIREEDLLTADEVFLTNSIYNIRWVASLENKTYSNNIVFKITKELCKKYPEIFV